MRPMPRENVMALMEQAQLVSDVDGGYKLK